MELEGIIRISDADPII